ncbi:MAG: glycosyltransferase family 2 protein, partial [Hyphomicrobiaceae bacterium]
MTRKPFISLVMATYGRSSELAPALQSLLAQTDHGFELIVVDQNRHDLVAPELQPLRKAGIAVKHVRVDIPSLSNARNAGLERAEGEVVAFPDDDCWYEPDVIAAARTAFESDDTLDGVVGKWCEVEGLNDRPPEPLSYDLWRTFRAGDASSITLFFRLAALRRIGGFDKRLGAGRYFGCGEETDVILRMLGSGARIEYLPQMRVHHEYAPWPG